MKKLIVTVWALLALAAPVWASQDGIGPQQTEQVKQRLDQIKDRLRLTPEQVEKVRPILATEVQKLKAVREKHSGDQSRRARLRMARELRDIQSSADEALRDVLSKEQMDELKRIRDERRAALRDRAAPR